MIVGVVVLMLIIGFIWWCIHTAVIIANAMGDNDDE